MLSIIAASMLGVATFAVGSMVAAYSSVRSSATPRAFALVVADDVSKTALSTFIAAFIFSVIARWAPSGASSQCRFYTCSQVPSARVEPHANVNRTGLFQVRI